MNKLSKWVRHVVGALAIVALGALAGHMITPTSAEASSGCALQTCDNNNGCTYSFMNWYCNYVDPGGDHPGRCTTEVCPPHDGNCDGGVCIE